MSFLSIARDVICHYRRFMTRHTYIHGEIPPRRPPGMDICTSHPHRWDLDRGRRRAMARVMYIKHKTHRLHGPSPCSTTTVHRPSSIARVSDERTFGKDRPRPTDRARDRPRVRWIRLRTERPSRRRAVEDAHRDAAIRVDRFVFYLHRSRTVVVHAERPSIGRASIDSIRSRAPSRW